MDDCFVVCKTLTKSPTFDVSKSFFYLLDDYRGSTIIDDNTQIMQQYFYTPCGEHKTAFVGGLNRLLSVMPVGYTGHEMVNHLNIIQMGSRTYDAKIGRFLRADITVQTPDNVQAYNKYSHVLNNPYTYTDPSGYFFKSLYKTDMIFDGRWVAHKITARYPTLYSIGINALNFIPFFGQFASAHASFDHSFVQTGSLGAAVKSRSIGIYRVSVKLCV